MIALFGVVRGPGAGRRIQLRNGQRATFGGTGHADYRFPDDRGFHAIHFTIDCSGGQCSLTTCGDAVTTVNGQPVEECRLRTGDSIRVGETAFSVTVDGATETESDGVAEESQVAAVDAAVAVMTMSQLWDHLELDSEAKPITEKYQEVEPLIDDLVASKLYFPALCLRAYTLANLHAVWWACVNLREIGVILKLRPVDHAALAAAESFVQNPSELSRREAQAASEAASDGPASMVAFAAFASGGSIGHPDVDPVEPDERLCGRIIAGALVMAGYCEPSSPHGAMSEMIANGKAPWKQQYQLPHE